jgi:CheY-like chemotaxis protein
VVRTLTARILEQAGYLVATAPDGAAALRALEGAEQEFDLVVTDVRMPKMDGWELGRRILVQRPMLPILYMSGYDVASRAAAAPLTFLRKPFEAPDLLGRVSRLLGED